MDLRDSYRPSLPKLTNRQTLLANEDTVASEAEKTPDSDSAVYQISGVPSAISVEGMDAGALRNDDTNERPARSATVDSCLLECDIPAPQVSWLMRYPAQSGARHVGASRTGGSWTPTLDAWDSVAGHLRVLAGKKHPFMGSVENDRAGEENTQCVSRGELNKVQRRFLDKDKEGKLHTEASGDLKNMVLRDEKETTQQRRDERVTHGKCASTHLQHEVWGKAEGRNPSVSDEEVRCNSARERKGTKQQIRKDREAVLLSNTAKRNSFGDVAAHSVVLHEEKGMWPPLGNKREVKNKLAGKKTQNQFLGATEVKSQNLAEEARSPLWNEEETESKPVSKRSTTKSFSKEESRSELLIKQNCAVEQPWCKEDLENGFTEEQQMSNTLLIDEDETQSQFSKQNIEQRLCDGQRSKQVRDVGTTKELDESQTNEAKCASWANEYYSWDEGWGEERKDGGLIDCGRAKKHYVGDTEMQEVSAIQESTDRVGLGLRWKDWTNDDSDEDSVTGHPFLRAEATAQPLWREANTTNSSAETVKTALSCGGEAAHEHSSSVQVTMHGWSDLSEELSCGEDATDESSRSEAETTMSGWADLVRELSFEKKTIEEPFWSEVEATHESSQCQPDTQHEWENLAKESFFGQEATHEPSSSLPVTMHEWSGLIEELSCCKDATHESSRSEEEKTDERWTDTGRAQASWTQCWISESVGEEETKDKSWTATETPQWWDNRARDEPLVASKKPRNALWSGGWSDEWWEKNKPQPYDNDLPFKKRRPRRSKRKKVGSSIAGYDVVAKNSKQSSASSVTTNPTSDLSGTAKKVAQLFRTSMCCFYAVGHCIKGDDCSHAHSEDQLRAKPALTKTRLCDTFSAKRYCKFGKACAFAHGVDELCATEHFFKTKMCRAGMKCKLGSKCRYAHHAFELQSSTAATTLSSREDASSEAPCVTGDFSGDDASRSSCPRPQSPSNSSHRCSVNAPVEPSTSECQAQSSVYAQQQPCLPTLQLPPGTYAAAHPVYSNFPYDCTPSSYAGQYTPLQTQSFSQSPQAQSFTQQQIMQILLQQQLPALTPSTALEKNSAATTPKQPFEFVGRYGTSPACLINLDSALFADNNLVTLQPLDKAPPDSCSEISLHVDVSPDRPQGEDDMTRNSSLHLPPGFGTPFGASDNGHGDNQVDDESQRSRVLVIALPESSCDDDDTVDDGDRLQRRLILDIATPDPSPRQHPDFILQTTTKSVEQPKQGNIPAPRWKEQKVDFHMSNRDTPLCSGKSTEVMPRDHTSFHQNGYSTPCIGPPFDMTQQQVATPNVVLVQPFFAPFNVAVATPMSNGTVAMLPVPALYVPTPTWGMFHTSSSPQCNSMAHEQFLESALAQSRQDQATQAEPTPDQSIPNRSTPDQSMSDHSTLHQSVPGQSTPDESTLRQFMPDQPISSQSVSDQSELRQSTPEPSTPGQSIPNKSKTDQSTLPPVNTGSGKPKSINAASVSASSVNAGSVNPR